MVSRFTSKAWSISSYFISSSSYYSYSKFYCSYTIVERSYASYYSNYFSSSKLGFNKGREDDKVTNELHVELIEN